MANGKPWFYFLRKHKKKSIAGAVFAGWLANYGINKYREYLIRRELCCAAKVYGDTTLSSLQKPRRLMVFFNSSSGKSGNAGDLFKKNAQPILYLAGLDVTTVKTDYEGQVKTLMQYIDPTIDGIVVAGGDGTVLEVVTGLLRRSDQVGVSKIPVGIIPLGDHNSLFRRLFPASSLLQARKIGNAAMAIVKGETQPVDVMEIKGDEGRSTFAMSSIHWGAFRDAISNQDKYWWVGRFRRTMSHIMLAVQEWPPCVHATLSHPVVGTSLIQASQTGDVTSTSLTTIMKSQALTSANCVAHADSNSFPHQPCVSDITTVNGWTNMPVKTFGLTVESFSPEPSSTEVRGLMHIKTWPSDFTKTEFIKTGWKLENMEKNSNNKMDETGLNSMAVKEFRLEPADNKVSWYTIDGELFPAQPITVTLLPNKLTFFWSPAGQVRIKK